MTVNAVGTFCVLNGGMFQSPYHSTQMLFLLGVTFHFSSGAEALVAAKLKCFRNIKIYLPSFANLDLHTNR